VFVEINWAFGAMGYISVASLVLVASLL